MPFTDIPQSYPDAALNIALDTLTRKKQALVFCNTKRGAESQAEKIAQKTKEVQNAPALAEIAEKVLAAVSTPTKQCLRLAACIRKGIAFHHSGLQSAQRELVETRFRDGTILIICATPTLAMGMDLPAFRSIIRDLKRYSQGTSWGMSDIPVLEYEQMAGRAGRPGKETAGEAICIAQTEDEKDRIVEKYLLGNPEDIYSKLAVEPVLRTYVLSLIASGYVHDTTSLHGFFDETFYAWQYEDTEKLHRILDRMVGLLVKWRFIDAPGFVPPEDPLKTAPHDDFAVASDIVAADAFAVAHDVHASALRATRLGERVAQLYLDPYTAHHMLTALTRTHDERAILADPTQYRIADFALLHLLCTTIELRPLLNVRQGELDDIDRLSLEHEKTLLIKPPTVYSHEYEEHLQSIKTAAFLNAWVEEAGEDRLFEEYNVRPGELQAKLSIADWLLYSIIELSKVVGWTELIADTERMRVRLEYGAKEELLALLRLKGIGRVRARKLYFNGIKSIDAVRTADHTTLRALIGDALARSIKEQLGEKVAAEDIAVKRNKRKGQINLADYHE
jgi:helicase